MRCTDECSQQLIAEVRDPLPPRPGDVAQSASDYERRGTAHLFRAVEPWAGKRTVPVTDQRTRIDWAMFMRDLRLIVYPEAAVWVLVMDNSTRLASPACMTHAIPRPPAPWRRGLRSTTRPHMAVG
jgi:DDE superfamily endonuclease